ncbi:Uncharacterised protein [Mycoplasmopsis caviae]|uniref:Uncharacterized protein n=1 Tax=Mycoplasmopsis caviae TaxID=55603 RepID=A0A3P8MF51_9BACT|nr:Uncharacterised protein [Mycoplasmopsis caviae]
MLISNHLSKFFLFLLFWKRRKPVWQDKKKFCFLRPTGLNKSQRLNTY